MPIRSKLDPASLLPPFDSSLPTELRHFGERGLREDHSLTRDTYSTQRFLCGDLSKPDALLETIQLERGHLLRCEASSSDLVRYCAQHDLELAQDKDAYIAVALVRAALLEVIRPHPFLWRAVSELAWRCHIVVARDDDYDVSFSDPSIPFSIFVSVPTHSDHRSVLRVAENLVHETMHLQLTLFERCCPLVDTTSSWSMYSPWKRQDRPAQGILHGLYVFHVLSWMWLQVGHTATDETVRGFALRRIREIDEEMDAVRSVESSPALTEEGKFFLSELFAS